MKTKEKSRKWMWGFLGMVLAMQMYFVRELLAAFALFALGFAAIASVVAAVYMLHHGWAVAVERVAESQHPAVTYAKRTGNSVGDLAGCGALAAVVGGGGLAKRGGRASGCGPSGLTGAL